MLFAYIHVTTWYIYLSDLPAMKGNVLFIDNICNTVH